MKDSQLEIADRYEMIRNCGRRELLDYFKPNIQNVEKESTKV